VKRVKMSPSPPRNALCHEYPVQFERSLSRRAEPGKEPVRREKGKGVVNSRRRSIAAPLPVFCLPGCVRSDGIERDIAAEFEEIGITVYDYCLMPALEDMPCFMASPVALPGIYAVELSHPLGEVRFPGFNDEMVMIVHKTVGITEPLKPVRDAAEKFDEIAAVFVVPKDHLTGVAAGGDMMQGAGAFNAEGTRH